MTFYKNVLCIAALSVSLWACEETEVVTDLTPDAEVDYKTEGFLISSIAQSSTTTYYAGFSEEIPSSDIDMTQFTSFGRYRIIKAIDGVMYGHDTNAEKLGLCKYVIDKESGEIEKLGEIVPDNRPLGLVILDENTALVANSINKKILIFDPSTMTVTGEVDMSKAQNREGFDQDGYTTLIHNEKIGKIFAVNYADIDATPQFYDAKEVRVEVIDATTLQHEKTIEHPNAEYAIFRGENNVVIDESGNTYLIAQGQYGLDGQVDPRTAPAGSRPQILKIDTSASFDTDYAFNPIDALGYFANSFQMFTGMVYGENNKAYGIGTAQSDDPQIQALLVKWATQGALSDEDYNTLVQLVLYSSSSKFLEIDLATKAVSEISGTPFTAGFSYPMLYNYDGKIYHQVTNPATSDYGFYVYDPNTGIDTKAYNITAGGFAYQLVNLKGF